MAGVAMTPAMTLEIHGNLREKEVTQRPYEGRSPFLSKRAEFIDWVHDVADKFRLRYTSAAAAIAYLDVCMDFYNSTIDFYELQVLAMACLMVGAKMEEQEPDIPLLTQVIKVAGLTCTVEQLSDAELMVLKAWSWNVCVVTPNHFIDMYSRESALDDMVTGREQALEHIDRIAEYSTEVARLASRDTNSLTFRPSVIATATVVCARTMLKAEPHYSASLQNICGIDQAGSAEPGCDLGLCCELLLRLCVSMDKPATSPITAHSAAMEGIVHTVTSPVAAAGGNPRPAGGHAAMAAGGPIRWPLQDMTTQVVANSVPTSWPAPASGGGPADCSRPAAQPAGATSHFGLGNGRYDMLQ